MERLAIVGAQLPGETRDRRVTIVCEDGRIADITERDAGALADTIVVQAGGRTAVPGLIDSHTHVKGYHPWPPGEVKRTPLRVAEDTVALTRMLPFLLASGITTIRDCGYVHEGIFAVRVAAERGEIEAPRLILSGQGVCATGGHGLASAIQVDGTVEMQRTVRRLCKLGADWIKLMMTGGTATPGEQVTDVQLSTEEAKTAVNEAHRRGKRVSAHCSNLEGVRVSLDAQVDSIEHGIDLDDDVIARMVDSGTWLSPAIRCTEVEATADDASGIPDYVRSKAKQIYERQIASFRRAVDRGVRFVVSTDAQQPYLALGSTSLVEEMELMVRLGLTRAQVLDAATKSAAEMLGLGDRLGAIAVGRDADILLVDGDPHDDLSTLTRPAAVVQRGRLIGSPSVGA